MPIARRRWRLRVEPLEERVVPTAEVEPNDAAASATAFATPTDTLSGTISSVADLDFFKANLGHGDTLTVAIHSRDPTELGMGPALEVISPEGQVVGSSLDGRITSIVAPAAGTYSLRLSAGQVFGNFTGSYNVSARVAAFDGVSESEPNDAPATAGAVGPFANFRGALVSASDVDYYSFPGTAGAAVAIKLGQRPAANPAVRLFDPNDNLVASNLAGNGLHAVLPVTGTYRLAVQGDNAAGDVTGPYVGCVDVLASSVVDAEPGNTFEGAAPWSMDGSTRAVGTLSSLSDVDVFAVTLSSPGSYFVQPVSPTQPGLSTQNRSVKVYNELGQLVRYSVDNGRVLSHSGWHTIQHFYVTIQAADETGLGAYSLTGGLTRAFPTQRDVPLYFHDYTGQTKHLGYGPAAPFDPRAVPQAVGMFEARYDIYDVDVTLARPAAGAEYAAVGVGEYSELGGGGLGEWWWGARRVNGDALVDTSLGARTGIDLFTDTPDLINHELGHASTLPHARHPLNFMAYSSYYGTNPVGSAFGFPGTDQRVPTAYPFNQREHLDWILQSGRILLEAEPNDSLASPQDLDPFLSEMTADAAPRNDRVVVVGRVGTAADADVFRITAAANETFAFDIDSAEFQYPLNAGLSIFDAAGNEVATSFHALDGDSGLFSADPYLTHRFTAPGAYFIRVFGQRGTAGDYRLKVTAGRAFDTVGPRVLAASATNTRQLLFWLNDQVDPATLTASTVIVTGASTGIRTGTATFDPLDATLVWLADAPLPVDRYTVTLKGGADGVKDLRGNPLDGETDGSFAWPERSGNGTAGGDFSFSFAVTAPDTTAAAVIDGRYSEDPSNRGVFTLQATDDLDVRSFYSADWRVRAAGPDNTFDTPDDVLVPADPFYNKVWNTGGFKSAHIFTRGVPDAGNYRIDGSFLDADGNTVVVSRQVAVPASALAHGPVIADVSVQPNTTVTDSITDVAVTFGSAVNPATLTAGTFVLRHSPDPTFYNSNDSFVADADGLIAWDPSRQTATFRAETPLANGYYLIELSGSAGGIASPAGRLLDGEFLDSNIPGNGLYSLWNDSPSGDGAPGGDYRAAFNVDLGNLAPAALPLSPALRPVLEDDADPTGQPPADFLAASVADVDLDDPKAMAVIGLGDAGAGTWQYSLDAGATWLPLAAVGLSSALLIGSTDRVRFVPATDFNGTTTVTYHAWDESSGVAGSRVDLTAESSRGGGTAYSVANQTATLAIVPVDDGPPVLAGVPAAATVARGGTLTFVATASDPDGPAELTFGLAGAPPGAAIDPATGEFSWTPGGSVSPGEYTFRVTVSDDHDPTATTGQAVTVRVPWAAVVGGDLVVGGTDGPDVIAVAPDADPGRVAVLVRGNVVESFPRAAVTGRAVVRGLGGADRVAVHPDLGLPADLDGGPGSDTLVGGAEADRLDGGPGPDRLTGGGGDDTLTGGPGSDVLVGGPGDDRYAFADSWGADAIAEARAGGADTLDLSRMAAGVTFRIGAGVRAAAGPNAAAGAHVENLVGGSGDDTFRFAPGGRVGGTIDGGPGANALDYAAYLTPVAVNLGLRAATGAAAVVNVTRVTGGAAADTLVGDAGPNALAGGGGRDVLVGAGGADALTGGAGDDLLVGGSTAHDGTPAALAPVRAEWVRPAAYAARVAHLLGAAPGGLNGTTLLDAAGVLDDGGAADTLAGGLGRDWFLTFAGDEVTDPAAGETVTRR